MKNFIANYTFVAGVRNHEVELHATGCRDLKARATSIVGNVDAGGSDAALAAWLESAPEAKVFTQACCNPTRMAAAGRLNFIAEAVADQAPVEEPVVAETPAVEVAPEVEPVAEPVRQSKRDRKRNRKVA